MYRVFEHTADLGLHVEAADLNGLFADAGLGLFSMIVENLDQVRPAEIVALDIAGGELEYLLFDWLNELLYVFETKHLVLAHFDVQVTEKGLKGTARGEKLDPRRHRLDHEVKAITYHGLKVEKSQDGWVAEVIVDI
jgi:SHS2 domain-containing protein